MCIFTSSILGISLLASPLTANASESVEGPEVTLVNESALTLDNGLGARASSGKGRIEGSNPIGLKPRASASTIMNSGTGWVVKAKVNSNNNGTSTSTSGWSSLRNTNKVSTPNLVALTEKTTFFGEHELKKTKTSSWEEAKTSISF